MGKLISDLLNYSVPFACFRGGFSVFRGIPPPNPPAPLMRNDRLMIFDPSWMPAPHEFKNIQKVQKLCNRRQFFLRCSLPRKSEAREQAKCEPHMTTYTHPELAAIIDAQKRVLRLLLVSIVMVVFTFLPLRPAVNEFARPAILFGHALIGLIGLVFIYRLARAIHDPIPWIYVICAFIPVLNTVTLLILNLRATAALRANHIEVGLMGAKKTPVLFLTASLYCCADFGGGQAADYHVGPNQTFNSIGAVPWPGLAPGDTVYIHWRADPYREKIFISNSGTADRPIRITGVPGAQGELPIVDGENATTSTQFRYPYSGTGARGLVAITRSQAELDGYKPKYIRIDGLELRNAAPLYTFKDAQGVAVPYTANAASVFIERGENITISNCTITGSGNGLFVASNDSEPFQSREILVQGNHIFGNGNVDSDRHHNIYTEAIGITFEFNWMGPLRTGAFGNNLKDRSAGTVIRYNWIEGGTQQMDLIDPEGSFPQALADPRYHTTLVYGNVIINEVNNASVVHYGGDSGNTDIYRKGTLYFYHNTVIVRSDQRVRWRTALLRLDTNDEIADVRNNIIYNVADSPGAPLNELSILLVNGKAQMGVNWISEGWLTSRTGVPFEGTLTGTENLVTGTDPGLTSFATGDYSLKPGSPAVDKAMARAQALPQDFEVASQYVPHQKSVARIRAGAALDLGAFELAGSGALLSMQRLPSGQFQITLRGPAGTYRLDVSGDLKSWRESSTRQTTDGNLQFLLTDPATVGFYRAALLPQ
jgi:hypothetical protein